MAETNENPPKATLTPMTDARGRAKAGAPVEAHFNPESLQLTIRNTMEAKEDGNKNGRPPQQLVSASEVSLALQLLFDTTLSGDDVRIDTARIAEMMRPGPVAGKEGQRRPAVVKFEWANFVFEGTITDYSETLDFFSAEGIPLRASLNLTMTRHEAAFPPPSGGAANVGAGSAPPVANVPSGASVDDVADAAGSPGAGTDLAAANGVEDIRNPDADQLAAPDAAAAAGAAAGAFGSALSAGAGAGVGIGIGFGRPPAAFASGAAGFGLDLGLSAGVGVGLAAGASLGGAAGINGSAGFGLDAATSFAAGAGVSAPGASAFELDAFAGLQAPKLTPTGGALSAGISFDLPEAPAISAGFSAGAGVSLGGAAGAGIGLGVGVGFGAGAGGGAVASVGKEIDLASILFEED